MQPGSEQILTAERGDDLMRLSEREAELLDGHLRQAAGLGRALDGQGGGLALLRALCYASTSLRRLRRLQALLMRELGQDGSE